METHIVRVAAPLRSQVEDAIRQAIADGELPSGTRLTERDLCERFDVSRPVIREALRQLAAEHLVEVTPNRGMSVCRLSLQDALDLYQVRAELEGLASSLVAAQRDPRDLAALSDILDGLNAAVARDDIEAIRRCKNAFYDRLVESCRNDVLRQVLKSLHNRIQLFRGAALMEPGRPAAAAAELRALFEAIRAGNPARARAAAECHLKNAAVVLGAALTKAEGAERRHDHFVPERGRRP